MANVKITELTALTAADSAATDVLPIVDVSADATKKLAVSDLHRSVPDGTLSAPGIAFQSDLNSGLYRSGTDAIALVTNGAARIQVAANGDVTIPNRVGIGTAGPGALLTLTDSVPELRLVDSDNSLYGTITAPGGDIFIDADKSNGAGGSIIRFAVDDNEAMRIDSSGNVGIGKASSGNKLEIEGQGNTKVVIDGRTDAANGSLATLELWSKNSSGTNNFGFIEYDGDGSFEIGSGGGGAGSVPLVFKTNASERMRINSSGNVGIGTSTGDAKLTVNSSGARALEIENAGSSDSKTLTINQGNANNGATNTVLDVGASSGNSILTTGKVGIGDSSPNTNLVVKGASNSLTNSVGNINVISTDSAAINAGGSIGLGGFYNGTSNSIPFANLHGKKENGTNNNAAGYFAISTRNASSGTAERMRIDSSGNVGIGTTSPSEKLEIVDDTNTDVFDGIKVLSNNQSAYVKYGWRGIDGIDQLRFSVGDTERMRINSSGNVGIGTTSPITYTNYVTLALSHSNGSVIDWMKGSTLQGSIYNAGDNFYIEAKSSVPMIFATNGAERMRIDSSGRLLVGTSSFTGEASTVLEGSSAGGTTQAQLWLNRGSTPTTDNVLGQIIFGDNNAAGRGGAMIQARADLSWNTNDYPSRLAFFTTADGASSPTERMRIASDGNVLIGTTTGNNATGVGVKLRVNSTASVDLVFDRSDNVNLNHVYNMNATRNGYRYYLALDGGIRNFSSNNVNLSDEREKKNIVDMDSTWSDLKQWTLRQFHFNDQNDSEDKRYGVIAQQIETVSPQVLSTFEINPTTVRKGVKETQMMWMAIKALQEAQERIETLEAKVAALEAQ